MTQRLSTRASGISSLLALASALGCESQVNDDYTGEPLFSLQGNVVATADYEDQNLVPRLGFHVADEEANSVVLVDGKVQGEFPARFRFDVTRPPPHEALVPPWSDFGLESKFSFGYLLLQPANSDKHIPNVLRSESSELGCTSEGVCTRIETECDEAGRCRERTLVCTQHPCDFVEYWGDATLGEKVGLPQSDYSCGPASCSAVESACDTERNCRTDVYSCDFAEYGEFDGFDAGVMTTCSVQSESGDTSLMNFADLQTVATCCRVVYVTEDNPNFIYGPLKRGYNLLRLKSAALTFLETRKCEIDAETKAIAEYNLEHGTEYLAFGGEPELSDLRTAAYAECEASVMVVDQPLDEVLTIELGSAKSTIF